MALRIGPGEHLVRSAFKDRIRSLFTLKDTPQRLALAFAVGVFIAFSPVIGLHTLMAVAIIWVFRMNTVVLFTGALINNPWTIVPLYAFCLWFGIHLTGSDISTPDIPWGSVGMAELFQMLMPYLWPFVAGTLVAGAAAAVLAYGFFYWAVKRYRRLAGLDAMTGLPVE